MGALFSSPSKQASQAASAMQGLDASQISNLENYVNTQQQNLRGAIAGQGPNPYFAAAGGMSPSNYAVNPSDTATFGMSAGNGLTSGSPTMTGPQQNPFQQVGAGRTYGPSPRQPENQTPQTTTIPIPSGPQQPGQSAVQQPPTNPFAPTPPPITRFGPITNPGFLERGAQ